MKGGKNKNSVSLSETETPPRSDAVAGDNGVNSEKALEVEEKERDMSAEGTEKEESDVGEDEDVEIQQEELVEVEKPKLAEGFYEIETVRRKRIRKGKIQYLIKWRGWPESANTWEPVENLMTCIDVIDAFEERLQSGKQRSTRKRKRTHGVTHSQIKRKQKQPLQEQQQHSSADATDNMAAVKVRISEEPVPSPPLASLNVIDHVDRNGSCSNNIKVANDNDLMLDSSVKEIEEQNELHLKLSERKGVTATKETSVETGPMATTETSVEAGMIASKETSVIKGVMTTTEISVENGMMPPPKDTSVEKGVMPPPKDTSVEKGVMPPPKDTSVEKGVMPPPKDTSVEKGVMPPPKDTSLEKEVIPTKEASAEKRVLATKETSVEKGVIPTKEAASVEKGMMPPPKDTSVEKEVMETTETSVEGVIVTGETSVDRSNNGFTSGFSMANVTESLQSGRSKGAKKRKSASVQRFKQQATSGVVKDLQDAEANATTGHLVTFMQEEIHNHELVGNALDSNNDTDAITEIIRALSYLPPNEENGFKEMSVTFLAKRSDGTEIIVDNKFLKTNDPLLLINFYEKHLRHQ